MKKTLAFVMTLALLCSLLAGCGSERADNGVTVPSGSPIIDPSMAPQPEDGIVEDQDGFIEDEDGRTAGDTTGKTAGDVAGDLTGDDAGIIGSNGSTGTASASPTPSADTQR